MRLPPTAFVLLDALTTKRNACERYAAAKKLADDARTKLTQEYEAAARKIVDILICIAQADLAIADVNGDLPKGCAAIESPEAIRSIEGRPVEVIREEIVDLWAFEMTGQAIPDGAKVVETTEGIFSYSGQAVHKRPFRRVTEYSAERSPSREPLALKLALPGLDGLTDIWEQSPAYISTITPDDVLLQAAGLLREQLAQEKREKTAKRIARTRLEPLPMPPAPKPLRVIASGQIGMA